MFPEIAKLALTLLRKGANLAVSTPYLAPPQVVGQAQGELRQQIAQQRIGDRLRHPAGPTRLLGLLEVVADRAGVDAQHPDLAGIRASAVSPGRVLAFASKVCDSPTLTVWVASLRSWSGCPGCAMARANSSGTSAAGE